MFFTRLMFFFVLIQYCLTSSCFKWHKPKPKPNSIPEPEAIVEPEAILEPEAKAESEAKSDEDDKLNRIIESEGWKSIRDICCRCENNIHDLNIKQNTALPFTERISEMDLSMKKLYTSIVFSALYYNVLSGIHQIYRNIFSIRQTLEQSFDKSEIIKSYVKFKPLITCMANAIEYFKYTYPQKTFTFLKDVLSINESLTNNNDMYNDPKIIQHVERNIIFSYIHLNDKVTYNDNSFITTYIEELRNFGGDNKRFMLDPVLPEFEEKVQEGVKLFCENFGFSQQEEKS